MAIAARRRAGVGLKKRPGGRGGSAARRAITIVVGDLAIVRAWSHVKAPAARPALFCERSLRFVRPRARSKTRAGTGRSRRRRLALSAQEGRVRQQRLAIGARRRVDGKSKLRRRAATGGWKASTIPRRPNRYGLRPFDRSACAAKIVSIRAKKPVCISALSRARDRSGGPQFEVRRLLGDTFRDRQAVPDRRRADVERRRAAGRRGRRDLRDRARAGAGRAEFDGRSSKSRPLQTRGGQARMDQLE
jgi:hypothetical protein